MTVNSVDAAAASKVQESRRADNQAAEARQEERRAERKASSEQAPSASADPSRGRKLDVRA